MKTDIIKIDSSIVTNIELLINLMSQNNIPNLTIGYGINIAKNDNDIFERLITLNTKEETERIYYTLLQSNLEVYSMEMVQIILLQNGDYDYETLHIAKRENNHQGGYKNEIY